MDFFNYRLIDFAVMCSFSSLYSLKSAFLFLLPLHISHEHESYNIYVLTYCLNLWYNKSKFKKTMPDTLYCRQACLEPTRQAPDPVGIIYVCLCQGWLLKCVLVTWAEQIHTVIFWYASVWHSQHMIESLYQCMVPLYNRTAMWQYLLFDSTNI
jgi:hypothetical protein